MSKVMGAVTDGGRHRMRLVGVLVAAVLAAGLVPWVSADTARPSGGGHGHGHDRGDDDFLFFAADGLTYRVRQDFDAAADQRDLDPAEWIDRVELAAGHVRVLREFLGSSWGPGLPD